MFSARVSELFRAIASSPTRSSASDASGWPRALLDFGIAPADKIAYLSFNNHQLLEGYYGVVQAGAIVMPLNVRLTESELSAILNHSGAKMLMFESDFTPLVEKLRKTCPDIEHWITLDEASPAADLTYEFLISRVTRSAPISFPMTRWLSPNCFIPAAAPARPRA